MSFQTTAIVTDNRLEYKAIYKCDQQECSTTIKRNYPVKPIEKGGDGVTPFPWQGYFNTLARAGWILTTEQDYCPKCADKITPKKMGYALFSLLRPEFARLYQKRVKTLEHEYKTTIVATPPPKPVHDAKELVAELAKGKGAKEGEKGKSGKKGGKK